MATGRTILKHTRVYVDGYDLSGYSRAIGPLGWTYDEPDLTVITDDIKGALPAHATLSVGALNGVMDYTATSSLHVVLNAPGAKRTVMVPIGIQAAPAQGDPVYMGEFEQVVYMTEGDYVTVPFEKTSITAATLAYSKPWGILLRPKTATTDRVPPPEVCRLLPDGTPECVPLRWNGVNGRLSSLTRDTPRSGCDGTSGTQVRLSSLNTRGALRPLTCTILPPTMACRMRPPWGKKNGSAPTLSTILMPITSCADPTK